MSVKYLFITGGVTSSLGKGVASAVIGCLLKARGIKVVHQKLDPYLNVDPGTMSPYQHGEVYVTRDGTEADLDLGHYERFSNVACTKLSSITSGQVYLNVIERERRGEYLGKTVQVIPHITDAIKSAIYANAEGAEVSIVEIGGTVGDIESHPFLEAIRQVPYDVGRENVQYLHLTLVPFIAAAGELKTKPTQHSVQTLRQIGIQPEILLCRTDRELDDLIPKIALFTNVEKEAVFTARDVKNIYELPGMYAKQGIDQLILKRFGLSGRCDPHEYLEHWDTLVQNMRNPKKAVTIAVVGKYVNHQDAYKSVYEALRHAGGALGIRVDILPCEADNITLSDSILKVPHQWQGLLVPGGFGARGEDGKISAIEYARTQNVPFLGICLGMQLAVVEVARNLCKMSKANTTEFNPETQYPVIDIMDEQKAIKTMGATMRLGAYDCLLERDSLAYKLYHEQNWNMDEHGIIKERHRHRFEVNNKFLPQLEQEGIKVSGYNPATKLVEVIERADHPYFVACQFHPEFESSPLHPHPLFIGFIKAAAECCIREQDFIPSN